MQVENTIPTAEAARKNRATLAAAYPGLLKLARGPVLVVLMVVAVLFGGSFASVRAAERSLPGDALYTLKLVTEQTRIALTGSKQEKVKLKIAFTKRRVEDLRTILSDEEETRKDERVNKAADILKQDLNTIKEQIADVRKESGKDAARDVAETAKVIDREVVEVVRQLRETRQEALTATTKKKVADAEAQAADVGIQVLEVLVAVSKEEEAKDIVTEDDIGASLEQHAEVAKATVAEVKMLVGTNVNPVAAASSTEAVPEEESSDEFTGAELAEDAEQALEEVQALLQERRIDEVLLKLKEASAKSFLAHSQAEEELLQASTSGTGASTDTELVEESEESEDSSEENHSE